MPILMVLLWLIVIGAATGLAVRFIPMPAPIARMIVIIVVILCVLWILSMLIGFGNLGPTVPRVR